MLAKEKIVTRFKADLRAAKSGLSKQWENTKLCQQFYSGNSMVWQDRIQFTDSRGKKRRAMIQFNKVMPFVDAVNGFMAQNRRVPKCVARVTFAPKQEFYSTHANAVIGYVRQHANSDQVEGEQNLDMLVGGYGAVNTDISYMTGNSSTVPNGEIIVDRLDPRNTFWDAKAKRKNITDRRFCGFWQDYDITDALGLFPDQNEADFGEENKEDGDGQDYHYDPYGGRYDKVAYDDKLDWASKKDKTVRVYNYQWFEFERYYQADNPVLQFTNPIAQEAARQQIAQIAAEADTGEGFTDMFSLDADAKILTFDKATKAKLVEVFGDYIVPVDFVRKRYYTAIISGDVVFNSWSSIHQQDFSIQFKTGTYDENRGMYIGMVNNMMEPQLYYNKALTELMFTIASNSKGGVIIEKGAVKDIAEFESKYASTTAVIVANEGAVSGNKIMPKGTAVPTTGLDGVITLTDAAIADSAGVDKSFLGSAENPQETGILYKRRVRQVATTLAKYFEAETMFQMNNTRLQLDYIRIWAENNEGALIELMGDKGQYEMTQVTKDPFMCEYGIMIEEAPQTPEDKQEEAELISSIGDKIAPFNPQGAQKIYAVAARSLNIDAEAKQQIIEALTPEGADPAQLQQELEAAQQQLQLLSSDTNKADVQNKLSSARLNDAKAAEIMGQNPDKLRLEHESNALTHEGNLLKSKELDLKQQELTVGHDKLRLGHKEKMATTIAGMIPEPEAAEPKEDAALQGIAQQMAALTQATQQALAMLAEAQQQNAALMAQRAPAEA